MSNQGAGSGAGMYLWPISQGSVAVCPPYTLPQAPAALCRGWRWCCYPCIPTVAFGKRGWVGSWVVAQGVSTARMGSQIPTDPAVTAGPAPAAVAHTFVTCLQGPGMESSKCYI